MTSAILTDQVPAQRSVTQLPPDVIDLTDEELRRAADESEFVLHYQPLVNLQDGSIEGAEALLRWQHPQRGTLPACAFIDRATRAGVTARLLPQILSEAAHTATALRSNAGNDSYVAVNIDPHQLTTMPLVEMVRHTLTAADADPASLVVEVTERTDVLDEGAAVRVVHDLRELGVRIAIDDFGTGHSSLMRVKQFMAAKVKIDRSFIADVVDDRDDRAIVASVVTLAEGLGLACIAEGIESPEQVRVLADLGCTSGQGFLWSGALSAADVVAEQERRQPLLVTAGQA